MRRITLQTQRQLKSCTFASQSATINEMPSIHVCEYDSELPKVHVREGFVSGFEYSIDSSSDFIAYSALCNRALYHDFFAAPKRLFIDLFLPIGYPASVGDGYLRYQIYDSLQGICSYLRGVVSTSAVLTAAGVGDAEATAMSAAMTWAMRDGMGMMGGLLFSYFASSHFDSAVKEYRLFADVINDVGLTLDMLAPFAGGRDRALFVASLASAFKVMCGVSAGATKGSITHHFAVRGNMADLTAKESTQETLVSLLGMIGGLLLARYLHRLENQSCIQSTPPTVESCQTSKTAAYISWAIFLFLTIVHVWANYRGVELLRLRTLNRERTEVAFRELIEKCMMLCIKSLAKDKIAASISQNEVQEIDYKTLISQILPPEQVSESLHASAWKLFFPGIGLGVQLRDAIQHMTAAQVIDCLKMNEKYAIFISPRGKVNLTLSVGAAEIDELRSLLHALLIIRVLKQGNFDDKDVLSVTNKCMDAVFEHLRLETLSDLRWDCRRLHLGHGSWRIEVNNGKHIKMS